MGFFNIPIFHHSLQLWRCGGRSTNLCGADDWFADPVAPASHHLLGEEDLLCWDFNAQVSTSNHDAVTGLQDLIEPTRRTVKVGALVL